MAGGAGAALADRRFRRWFAAQVLSASGAATQLIGMSWIVAGRTGSGVALGALTCCMFVPVLLLGPLAGGLIDRVPRRSVLLATQSAFLVIGVVLTVAVALGESQLWLLYAAALATGVVYAFDGPARQVFLMDLLEPHQIPAAIGLYEVVINASRVLGPALAGVLLATSGVVWCFVLNAVAFVRALVVLLLERRAGAATPFVAETGDLRAAARFLRSRRDVCALLVVAAGFGLSGVVLIAVVGAAALAGRRAIAARA